MIIQDVFEPTLKEAMQTLGKGAAVNQNTGVYSINDVTNQIKQGRWGVNYPANDMTTARTGVANSFVKTGRLNLNGNFAGYYDLAYWNGNLTINDDNELGAFLDNFFFTGNTDTHSALVYINGDLNIHYPCIIKPRVRKLFTCFYIAGAFTHNGLISMTDRGANHSGTGNSHGYTAPIAIPINGTVTIPAAGGAGGARAVRTSSGSTVNVGGTATYGTGGGGSGHNHVSSSGSTTAGAGSAGTCFSGGGGGCGTMTYNASNTISAENDAQPNGGAGGKPHATVNLYGTSGGSGNPGGMIRGSAGSGFGDNTAGVRQPSNGGFMEQNALDPYKGIGTERGPGRYVDAGNGTAGVFIAMCEGDYTGSTGRIESRGKNHGNYHEIGGNGAGGGRGGAGGGGIGMIFGGTATRSGPTPVVDGGAQGNNFGGAAGGAGTGAIYAL